MGNQRRFALIGRGFGSDDFKEAVEDVIGAILTDSAEINFTYTDATPSITAALIDGSIAYARIANASSLSVLGRASNSSGVLADIQAGTDNQVLRRSGTAIAFGAVNLASSDAVTGDLPFANIAQITGQAVLGVSTAGAGDLAAISAGTNDRVLRQTGDALNFGQLTVGMFPDAVVTFAKLQNADAVSVLGRSANSSGVLDEIAAAANDRILRRTSDTINFGQLTAGMFPNTVVPDAALSSNVPLKSASNIFASLVQNISGTGGRWGVESSGTLKAYFQWNTTTGVFLANQEATPMHFQTNATDRYVIDGSGNHDFKSGTISIGGATTLQVDTNAAYTFQVTNVSNGTANASRISFSSGDANAAFFVTGSGRSTPVITNGPTGAQAVMRSLGTYPIIFGVSNTYRAGIDDGNGAGTTSLLLYDVDNGQVERVSVGAADSGGSGFKVLRIPN